MAEPNTFLSSIGPYGGGSLTGSGFGEMKLPSDLPGGPSQSYNVNLDTNPMVGHGDLGARLGRGRSPTPRQQTNATENANVAKAPSRTDVPLRCRRPLPDQSKFKKKTTRRGLCC